MNLKVSQYLAVGFFLCVAVTVRSETVEIGTRRFAIPDGYELKLAAQPGITERPIVADFDHDGHLYVAESSGTNDNVQKQLKDKPHSILRLSDTNGDGVFDKRTVFADRMMFPAGVLYHQGSVYVSAPPQIWKLTDKDNDGVADVREVWFDAKTLTGCANDLHGPYAGLDGWIYWCKGAFAEQTYDRAQGEPFVTRAAHIFRRRPEGGIVEPVMTGGMDNPVDVAFTATGERIFTTTFFQHPANGQRDGLVHAIYGGVYGKEHGVLEGHPRTGPLMPVLTHLGAAAPSGLVRLESNALGFRNDLLTACFNLHSVTRHELVPQGATFSTKNSVLVSTEDLDFHPTDVIEDADGSVLIVDTGGWYKLCCPTSQLHKPDMPGAIYRLTKTDARNATDLRGQKINWKASTTEQLAEHLGDNRFKVRHRAIETLANRKEDAIASIRNAVSSHDHRAALNAVWAACRIDSLAARDVVRLGLNHREPSVRQAAIHAVSVWRDKEALAPLRRLLQDDSPHVQRAAAEAIGRLGANDAVPDLFKLLDRDTDRTLQHSLIYALIEIGSAEEARVVLATGTTKQKHAAMTAILGMGSDDLLSQDELLPLLTSGDAELRLLATSMAKKREEWSASFAQHFRREIQQDHARLEELSPTLGALAGQPAINQFIADLLTSEDITAKQKSGLLQHVAFSAGPVEHAFAMLLRNQDPNVVSSAVRKLSETKNLNEPIRSELTRIAGTSSLDAETRLLATRQLKTLAPDVFDQVVRFLSNKQPARVRSLAVSVLENAKLDEPQLHTIAKNVGTAGPLELSRLLRVFENSKSKPLGVALFRTLIATPTATSLPADQLEKLAKQFGDEVQQIARPLLAATSVDAATQSQRLDKVLASLPHGDIRRGQKLFHAQKHACFTCHAVGYLGGAVGPDLTRIGRTRSRRDLLEAIFYPSASFVRSYEPVNVITTDGKQWSGTIRDQTPDTLKLQLNATELQSIRSDEIEEILPGKVSIMPSGLDKQLTNEQLADLLAFLESRK